MAPEQRARAALPVLFSVVIVDLIGFGIVMPILPFYAREFGANGAVLGLLLTSYAAAQFVFAPVWGRLSDRLGRRKVLLATIGGTSAALLLLGLAPSLAWMFAAREVLSTSSTLPKFFRSMETAPLYAVPPGGSTPPTTLEPPP